MKTPAFTAAVLISTISCSGAAAVFSAPFGKTASGAEVTLYTLRNSHGMEVQILDYGAIIASIKAPDRDGNFEEVTLGYDALEGWENDRSFFGATLGRYAGRIANGRFTLDGKTYELPVNNGPNSLHGGPGGFHKQLWKSEAVREDGLAGVRLTLVSPDGDQGYPGAVTAQVTYTLGEDNDLRIDYRFTTDAPTVVNPSNHAYFNLAGDGSGLVTGHEIQINASRYTPADAAQIPTGELAPVEGTPMDFREPASIGARIDADFPPLAAAGGYDHNYVLDGEGLRLGATVYEPKTGRVMEMLTTAPGVQFFSGNSLRGRPGRAGRTYPPRSGFCLETQYFPDSPNKPDFPSTMLRPGEEFTSTTIYRFSTR